ncbi:phosphonatase-like hydrolase [Elizabethkingia sp. JS20170427COW]|uniref:phosphonatase-like hydrolase n=1 Tax=Elizabethkingia sp. JS20170427COW TaxID=2583851 RepID=UPI001110D17A|nr:phosphonatase-like hydrolase [Elizabethkingia sp. JS20170427COW]QCX52780.1 phosphonatase-like hydrolase [Elizabethkingia sp. JS20170427COW]
MTNIEMVIFDMAGTTINENNLVYKTIHKAFLNQGFQISLDQVLEEGAGKEKRQAIQDILTKYQLCQNIEQTTNTIFEYFKVALSEAYNNIKVSPIEGVPELFKRLKQKGIKIILNTGYDSKTTYTLLQQVGWKVGKEIDLIVNADDVSLGRPHPDMIIKAMNIFNISNPQKVLKAGDSDIDILEGKNAKCGITVGVLSGAQNKEQLEKAHPDYILNSLADLDSIFN